jgi:hypothetical protein
MVQLGKKTITRCFIYITQQKEAEEIKNCKITGEVQLRRK